MGMQIIDTNHEDQGPQTEISWNERFIGAWDNKKERIPDELRPLIADMMKEVWLDGRRAGAEMIQSEFRNLMGV